MDKDLSIFYRIFKRVAGGAKISREKDEKIIESIPKDKLADFIFMHIRDMWAVDGLYYLRIEEKWGTVAATEIDRNVWDVMGKIEARKI